MKVAHQDCRRDRGDVHHCAIWRRHDPQAHVADVSCGSVACDQAYLVKLIGPAEAACAEGIIDVEDRTYNPEQWNLGGSTAYGIPQALPGSKMAAAGADWATNPDTQLRWMTTMYFGPAGAYPDACAALEHEHVYGWY